MNNKNVNKSGNSADDKIQVNFYLSIKTLDNIDDLLFYVKKRLPIEKRRKLTKSNFYETCIKIVIDDYRLEIFYILHKRKLHLLSQDRFKFLVNKMIPILKNVDLHKTYKLAMNFPDDENCQTIIRDYENSIPKKILHSQNKIVQIIENKNLSLIDGRRSLFKSAQEKEFFDAVRVVYPQFIVYPNVAVSSILNFESIKTLLSDEEKNYFFMAIVDCVVFDYQQLYLPKYFFELDSLYHDEPTQMRKDEYKNNIFSAAGQKIHRIRKIGNNLTKVDFTRLIKEILATTE